MPLVPSGNQALGVLEDLRIEFAARLGFLPGGLDPLIFHLALVEAHSRIVAKGVIESTGNVSSLEPLSGRVTLILSCVA